MRTYLPILVIASSLCLQSCAELAQAWGLIPQEDVVTLTSSDTLKEMVTLEYDPYKDSATIRTPKIYITNLSPKWLSLIHI